MSREQQAFFRKLVASSKGHVAISLYTDTRVTVRYKELWPWEWLAAAIGGMAWLGSCYGHRERVVVRIHRMRLGPIGDWLFRKTVVHESVHISICLGGGNQNAHNAYDRKTWHGLLQFRLKTA